MTQKTGVPAIGSIQITNYEMNAAVIAIKALEMMHKDGYMAKAIQYLREAEYEKELKFMKSIRRKFQKELKTKW